MSVAQLPREPLFRGPLDGLRGGDAGALSVGRHKRANADKLGNAERDSERSDLVAVVTLPWARTSENNERTAVVCRPASELERLPPRGYEPGPGLANRQTAHPLIVEHRDTVSRTLPQLKTRASVSA